MKKVIRNTTPADRLLFLFLMIASVVGIFISKEALPQSSNVLIEIDGKPAYTFPLNIDKTVSVGGPYGNTVIEIRDKKVRVREAGCPNRICVKEGWVSKGVIVCLPNKIVVFIGGRDNNGKELDATSG